MLLMLLPEQTTQYWGIFKRQIEDSPPPIADYGPYNINNILTSIMMGGMQLWVLKDTTDELVGFVLTTILRDVSGVSTLLIYNAAILGAARQNLWLEGLETLIKFGRNRGCAKIASFVCNEKLISLAKDKGLDSQFVFINYNI